MRQDLKTWPAEWVSSVVRFWCDNMAVVFVINNMSSRSEQVMKLVRVLVLHKLQFNLVFHARHIPSIDNNIADALSRQQME